MGTCKLGIALLFLQEASEVNENVLTWLISSSHQTLAGRDSKNSWWTLHEGNGMPIEARGGELAAGKDSELLKMATICSVMILLIFPSLLGVFALDRLKIWNCRNYLSFLL